MIILIDIWGKMSALLDRRIPPQGNIHRRRMTDQAVLVALQKRARIAGVAPFSAHDFRRTFISELLSAKVDVVTVQKLAGHASPETVAVYDRRGEEEKRRAVEWLQVPYVKRYSSD